MLWLLLNSKATVKWYLYL